MCLCLSLISLFLFFVLCLLLFIWPCPFILCYVFSFPFCLSVCLYRSLFSFSSFILFYLNLGKEKTCLLRSRLLCLLFIIIGILCIYGICASTFLPLNPLIPLSSLKFLDIPKYDCTLHLSLLPHPSLLPTSSYLLLCLTLLLFDLFIGVLHERVCMY